MEEKREIWVTNQEMEETLKNTREHSNSLFEEIFEDGLNSPELIKTNKKRREEVLWITSGKNKMQSKNAQIKVIESLQYLSNKFDDMEKENEKKD